MHGIAQQDARLLGRQLLGNVRDVLGVHGGELGVETALGVREDGSVHAVSFLEAADPFAEARDRARAVGAKHVGELLMGSEPLGKAAFAFEGIPCAHAGRLDADQDLIRPFRRRARGAFAA